MIAGKFRHRSPSKNFSHEELIFLAQDTVENIRHLKNVSHTFLAGHIATFGYVSQLEPDKANVAISFFFLISCCICICLFWCFFPEKIRERRQKLKRVYDRFTPEFKKAHGNVSGIANNDKYDLRYRRISTLIPILSMILIIFIQICHTDSMQCPTIVYFAGPQLSPFSH